MTRLQPGQTVTTWTTVLGYDIELEADDQGTVRVKWCRGDDNDELLGLVHPDNQADLDTRVEALVRDRLQLAASITRLNEARRGQRRHH